MAQERAETSADAGVLQEIVVTAEKTETNIQRTPIAIVAMSGADLREQGKTSVVEALRRVPGVEITVATSGTTGVFIRGVGPQTIGGGTTSTTSLDDIFYTNPDAIFFYDMGQVSVLKGPQGTLQGRGSTGGSVLVTTAEPTADFGGFGSIQYGNFHALRLEAAANVPLADNVLTRFSAVRSVHGGYLSNGQDDESLTGFRAKLAITATPKFKFMLAAEYDENRGRGDGVAISPIASHPQDPWLSNSVQGLRSNYKQAAWGRFDYDLGFGLLTYEPSWYEYRRHQDVSYFQPLVVLDEINHQITQELRLTSRANSRVKWVAGAFYLNYRTKTDPFASFMVPDVLRATGQPVSNPGLYCLAGLGGPARFGIHNNVSCAAQGVNNLTNTAAGFGQLTYPVTDALRLVGGLRYEKTVLHAHTLQPRNVTPTGAPAPLDTATNTSYSAWTWKAGAEYDIAPRSLLYATVSTAYRPGGVNVAGGSVIPGIGTVPTLIEAEKMTAFEVGSKNRFLDNRLQLNVAAWYYKYKGGQVGVVGPSTPASAPRPTVYTINADSTVKGAEAALSWLFSRNDQLDVSVLYNDATFDNLLYPTAFYGTGSTLVPGATCAPFGPGTNCYGPGAINRSGAPLTLAPKWTESVGYEHRFDLGGAGVLSVRGDIRFVSQSLMSIEPVRAGPVTAEAVQKAYHKTDLRVTYTPASGPWTLTAFVNNLENKAVKQFLQGQPVGAPDTVLNGLYSPPIFRAGLAPPRTYGAQLSMRF